MQDWLLNASDYNWRLDPKLGGESAAFGDIGSHWFDLVEHVTGRRVTELHSRLRTAVSERVANLDGFSRTVPIQVDDSGVVSFELDNGGLGSAVVSQVAPGRKNHLWFEISGSESSVSWSQEDPDRLWIGHRDQANERPMRDVGMAADEALPPGHPFGWRDAIRRNLRTAYQQILEPGSHGAMPFATFADGHRSLQLVEALMRSSEERIAIVPPQVVEASKSGG
jgi:predicted dehydrogenase